MDPFLFAAFLSNSALFLCEVYTLANVRKKKDIFRYYTFLQNLLALGVSFLFSVYAFRALFFGCAVPGFVKGLRYTETCGLAAAALIFAVFLSSKEDNLIKEEDFRHLSPAKANFMIHVFNPLLSLLSLLLFERQLPQPASLWTLCAALPSCLYWMVYLILSAAHLWEGPYVFPSAGQGKKGILTEALTMLSIPLSFLLISFVLWNLM